MCAEHPEADAGERDGPQRVSAGHVQEEVTQLLNSMSIMSTIRFGFVSPQHYYTRGFFLSFKYIEIIVHLLFDRV